MLKSAPLASLDRKHFAAGAAVAKSEADLAKQEQSRIVRIAEDHALAHVGERLYVSDLCRATGVGERTLEVAFKQTMGLTPVAYLARLRLHRVRDALRTPTRSASPAAAQIE